MSNLTKAECEAGISRAALATLRGQEQEQRIIGDGTKEILVINTPYHKVSILETPDGPVIRQACFVGNKCDVDLIHVDYEQGRKLGSELIKLLDPVAVPHRGRA